MPTLATITATVKISPRAAAQIKRGVLWVYSNEILDRTSVREPGEWCWFESQGEIVGTGYLNPHSLISGRLLSFKKELDVDALVETRLKQSLERRGDIKRAESLRLVFSEADFFPGLIADLFSGALVIQSNTAGLDRVLPVVLEILPRLLTERGLEVRAVALRCDTSVRTLEGVPVYNRLEKGNEEELKRWFFKESGVLYCADLLDGQKTGFFLDQKENREFLEHWTASRPQVRVLDLFCYSGGWGFRALKAGAGHVEFVDQSKAALELVKTGAEKNGFSADRLSCTAADAFDTLETSTQGFDAVVADPPAFVKSKKNLPQARKAYEKLTRLCWRHVKPGGLLLISSCSYHLSEPDFLDLVQDSIGREEGLAHVVYRGRQGADHPVLLSMPETRYLKCIGLQKLA